ncbi:MAG: prepilin-type N-terminal cleavage/methylation domain-containing protein [Patescibacteria group bacterium]
MKIENSCQRQAGFSLIEIILAAALFMIMATGSITVILQGLDSNRLGEEQTVANQYAAEGMEAVRSIKNQGFSNLVNSAGTGIAQVSSVWAFSGGSNILSSKYTRVLTVSDVQRDCSGNIVASGGTTDSLTKKIMSTVSWNFTPSRANSVQLSTYLSDWKQPITSLLGGGILVYGDGGTTSDAIRYKTLDPTGSWGIAALTADVDNGTTNRYLRAARIFSSATRNEKVLISRHYNGSTQFIYAQVFNGTTWGNVVQLSSWNTSNFLDVRNFDGGYLDNGNFLVVFNDNTNTPKYRVWDGCSWSSQASTINVGGIPRYLEIEVRPGANEAMMVVSDSASDTNTSYFNGTVWSSATQHSGAAPTNTKDHTDFVWSRENPLKGALVFPNAGSDTTLTLKIWTANGSGGGSWSGLINSAASGGRLGAAEVDSRKGAEEFLACQKDANNDIYCFRGNSTPAWVSPTNNILTATSHTGIQRSFSVGFERTTGTQAIVVYSDNTATPKLRKYSAGTNAFDASATSLTALGGVLTTARTRPLSDNDDIMILMGNANNDLFSIVWDGNADAVYTTGGKAHTSHGISGSDTTDFWYDFAWDKF